MPNLKNKWEKEVKKIQKTGIYNSKLKLIVFGLVLIIGTTIGVSYAYFIDQPSDVLNIDATVSKKINVELTTNADSTESSFADIILKNNQVIDESTDFTQGFPNLSTPESEKENKSGLYKTNDDDGETYYFRGKVDNNYVMFANKIWRIVRVNGDKTVRLILNSSIGISEFNKYDSSLAGNNMVGFTYNNKTPCTTTSPCKSEYQNGQFTNKNFEGQNSTIKTKLEEWYHENLNDYDSYIAYGTFCNDTSYGGGSEASGNLYYGPYERLRTNSVTPQLMCPDPTADSNETKFVTNDNKYHTYGGVYKLKIGLINADEAIMSGINSNNMVNQNATPQNYLFRAMMWATASPIGINSIPTLMGVGGGGIINPAVYQTYDVFPIINLTNDKLVISGDGSQATPYKIIGSIKSTKKTVDYDTAASFNVISQQDYQYKGTSCDNKSAVTFTDNTLTVTPKSSKNIMCSLEFGKKIEIFNHEYSVHLELLILAKAFLITLRLH